MQRMRQSREKPYQSEWNVPHRVSVMNGTAEIVSQADIWIALNFGGDADFQGRGLTPIYATEGRWRRVVELRAKPK